MLRKALADQVEPRPFTVAGNYLVLRAPVEPDEPSGIGGGAGKAGGLPTSGRVKVVDNQSSLTWGTVLEQRGIDFTVSSTRLVPIPTGGVFAEAVLGRSNSAEKLDITRFWNWQDSPIPLQPPEISPVGTGSRGIAEDLAPGYMARDRDRSTKRNTGDHLCPSWPVPHGTENQSNRAVEFFTRYRLTARFRLRP